MLPAPSLWAQDEDVIHVIGHRREVRSTRDTGRSLSIMPTDESRFDTLTHLRRESTVVAPETGRISPSGFVVPRVRGQDVKLTDVYLEDVLLQDPYGGLPAVEDLDLRAFGALEVHQGVPPPDVPGLNPIATLRYRFRDQRRRSVGTGLMVGRPYGLAGWTLGEWASEGEGGGDGRLRIYARQHQTDGRYRFYSDEGTPYNTEDDRLAMREHNDQSSHQLLPFGRYRWGDYDVQVLGWSYQATRSIPSMSVLVPSAARERARGTLANLRLSRDLPPLFGADRWEVGLGLTRSGDERAVKDPEQQVLPAAESGELAVSSRRVTLTSHLQLRSMTLFAAGESGVASAQSQLGERQVATLERRADVGTLGSRVRVGTDLTIEAKGLTRRHRDEQRLDQLTPFPLPESADGPRTKWSRASGLSVAYHPGVFGGYVQHGLATRLPSLIEEFGNGSTVQGNQALAPEVIRHREAGLIVQGSTPPWQLGVSVYEDRLDDKIVVIPVSANSFKATNLRRTETRGVDARGEVSLGGTTLFVSGSRIFAYDRTRSPRRQLPGFPERVVVTELAQKWGGWTGRWLGRYRSEVYRDLGNAVVLPGSWIHDASMDQTVKTARGELKAGLALRNVFDVLDVPIAAPETPENRGRTALSDLAGAPLPGRQWVVSVAVTL